MTIGTPEGRTTMSDKELNNRAQENNEVTEEFHLGESSEMTEEFHLGGSSEKTEEFHLGGSSEKTEEFHLGESSEMTEEFHIGDSKEEFHIGGDISSDQEDIIHQNEDKEIDYTISDDGNSIIIDADDPAMDIVQGFIREKLKSYGCDKKIMLQIRLAVEEIFINIISYAYRPDVGKAEVLCEVKEDPMCVIIQFMDSGKPFDPLAYDEVDTSGQMFMERVGGFGIHLVKNTMDAVTYEYKEGKNILKIKKNF